MERESEQIGMVKSRYSTLSTDRDIYLQRARDAAALTIPTLIPPEGYNKTTTYVTPYQGLGARGVNNLAAKMLIALFPPNRSFFRLKVDEVILSKLGLPKELMEEVDSIFSSMERAIMKDLEPRRTDLHEAMKHLIVAGNVLLYMPKSGALRVFHLHRYVVKRDGEGNVLETITLELESPLGLDQEVIDACAVQVADEGSDEVAENVEVYTYTHRTESGWETWQEINGIEVPDSYGTYPKDRLPYLPLRYTKIDNEDYGRGFIEEYQGDLQSLETLRRAIAQGSAAAAKVLFLVKPNSTTKLKVLAESESGDIREGNAEDVTVLQLEKFADFKIALETIKAITEELSWSFLLNTAVQRDAERVTAEEIRYVATELEDALGGVYSIMTQELQLPIAKLKMHQLQKDGKLPSLPKDTIEPEIITGLEALGRTHDLQKLRLAMEYIKPLGEQVIKYYINIPAFIQKIFTNLGLEMGGVINSEERAQELMQKDQQAALIAQLGPQAIQQGGQMMQNKQKANLEQEQGV